jgi:hypothetical protein
VAGDDSAPGHAWRDRGHRHLHPACAGVSYAIVAIAALKVAEGRITFSVSARSGW